MFIGAYWKERKEPRDEVAGRLARFFSSLATGNAVLSRWFLKGRTRESARTPLELNADAISAALEVNRRDVGAGVLSELGFNLGVWNGADASLAATMGASSPHIANSVVLTFLSAPEAFDKEKWRRLLAAAVSATDSDHAVVTSMEHLAQSGATHPWEAGLFTYHRGGSIEEHPFKGRGRL